MGKLIMIVVGFIGAVLGLSKKKQAEVTKPEVTKQYNGMKISRKGLELIMKFEGFSARPYRDAVGVCTIGYGTTRINGRKIHCKDSSINQGRAIEILEEQINDHYGHYVNKWCGTMTQNQFDALVSFAYNLGVGALHHSTLLKYHLAGNYNMAHEEFKKWDHAGGRVLKGLSRRRALEAALYLS